VALHVWGVPTGRIPQAVARMGLDRRPMRALPGLRFAKLLGTGSGRTFTVRDADPHHWAVLTVWDDEGGPDRFDASSVGRGWDALADERARFVLRPLSARGRWAGRSPFGDPVAARWDGPVAAITRARIRPKLLATFWRSVPPVSLDLHAGGGVLLAMGIGEAPVALQGTFSVWADNKALTDFAHRRAPHREAMARTAELGWYAEELFARFAVVDARGSFGGRPVPGAA
jgi:heme-degrading monooxygenase HmoA